MKPYGQFRVMIHHRRLPKFIGDLQADLRFLASKDLPHTFAPPARRNFSDDARYYAALEELKRLRKFAIVREAVIKHEIRESLGPRFWSLKFSSPIMLSFCIAIVLEWLGCLLANPHIADWFSATYWYYSIRQGWF
jgi:hypothetical protein